MKANFEYVKELFDDHVQTIFRAQENRNNYITIYDGNVTSNGNSCSAGVSARVCEQGVYGFASLSGLTKDNAVAVLKQATENARIMAKHVPRNINIAKTKSGILLPEIAAKDVTNKKILDACREIDNYIVNKYSNIKSRSVYGYQESQEKIIYTSDANEGHVMYPRTFIYVTLVSEDKDGESVELYDVFGGNGYFEEYFSSLEWIYEKIDVLYHKLMEKIDAVYAQAGYKTVILDGKLAGMLSHEAVGHTVEADLVKNGSVAGKNMNKQVASEVITMVDFANEALGEPTPIPVYMDDEGVEAKDVTIIENGILKNYMHSRESAGFYDTKPLGNARAWSYADEPLIRMRNTAILPGKDKLEDMIASVEDGYYLINTTNGQADLTGEFMFGVDMGYEIKNGKLGRAIKNTTVSGVAFEMLKTVDMMSDSIEWVGSGYCGKKQSMAVSMGGPAMRCKMMIGGR